MEFLEKFVNVKISLFLSADVLSKYVSENFDKAMQNNLQMDPRTRDKIKEAISAVKDIYASADFHKYENTLGDVRKLKRLINTLVLFEIDKVDFENSDFNKEDLIHLLLIYINYPNVFRKIYNTETGGKRGFFSALIPHEPGYPPNENSSQSGMRTSEQDYKNSTYYTDYLNKLPLNAQFLLNKIFAIPERLGKAHIDGVLEEIKKSYACFNGGIFGGGRNLEEYLNLIVKLSKPPKATQYRFYLNFKNKLLGGVSIREIFEDGEFSYTKSESNRQQLWRIVVNSAFEFSALISSELISNLLDHMPEYSLFTNDKLGLGLRDDIDYFLVTLLNVSGWSDAQDQHGLNDEANIAEIAEWILGEGRHADKGVIATLATEDRGVLGLYDLMAFRLFCCADRGGDVFNLQRALIKHSDPAAPTDGSMRVIVAEEMRETSQKVFRIFKDQYITPNVNLFDAVDELTIEDLSGEYHVFVQAKIASGELAEGDVDSAVSALKSRIKSFIIYQLGNTIISQGIGCGYYDETGRGDNKGIAIVVNNYLFGQCFDPAGGQKNYEHFVDYLLINFASAFMRTSGRDWMPQLEEFTKVLDRKKLAEYWETNATAIRILNLQKKEKTVATGNYVVSYKNNLPEVYQILDELVTTVAGERQTADIKSV
jgi:hypothetical protein